MSRASDAAVCTHAEIALRGICRTCDSCWQLSLSGQLAGAGTARVPPSHLLAWSGVHTARNKDVPDVILDLLLAPHGSPLLEVLPDAVLQLQVCSLVCRPGTYLKLRAKQAVADGPQGAETCLTSFLTSRSPPSAAHCLRCRLMMPSCSSR